MCVCVCVYVVTMYLYMCVCLSCLGVQQKIRRDREKREERRMGGKQQVAKGKLRDMYVRFPYLPSPPPLIYHPPSVAIVPGSSITRE